MVGLMIINSFELGQITEPIMFGFGIKFGHLQNLGTNSSFQNQSSLARLLP